MIELLQMLCLPFGGGSESTGTTGNGGLRSATLFCGGTEFYDCCPRIYTNLHKLMVCFRVKGSIASNLFIRVNPPNPLDPRSIGKPLFTY